MGEQKTTDFEVTEIADALALTDEDILGVLRESIKRTYKHQESLANGGAMVYLDDEANATWDAAIGIAFDRWCAEKFRSREES